MVNARTAVTPVIATPARDAAEIVLARRIQATVFLRCHYITEEDLEDGLISPLVDPWVPNSTYFLARDAEGRAHGASRLIAWDDDLRLPTVVSCPIWPDAVTLIAGNAHATAEVSALAVLPGAPRNTSLELYSAMWRYGCESGDRLWLMSVKPEYPALLHSMLGEVSFPIGDVCWYLGSDVVPRAVNTRYTHDIIAEHAANGKSEYRRHLAEMFPPNKAWNEASQPVGIH